MKLPGPDHPITIAAAKQRWRVRYGPHVIADSGDALVLKEATYPQVIYFPREDVSMEFLGRTDHSTHCPYKGDASYYSIAMDGDVAENAVWSYETPFPAMAQIAGRLAFYPNKVEIYAVDDAAVNPHHVDADVDAAVQHTDEGDGLSQRDRWPPNVSEADGGVR